MTAWRFGGITRSERQRQGVAVYSAERMTRDSPSPSRHARLGGRFYTLWTGQAISQLGDYVAFLTVPLFVATLTGRALDFGLVYAAETIPALLFGVLGGVLLDRFPLRSALIISDLARAAGFVILGLVAASAQPEVWMIVTLAFFIGLFAASFAAGLQAFLPVIVPSEQLATANARLVLSQQALFLLGPAIGGFLVALVGFSTSYYINAITFVVSAVTLALLRNVPRRELISRTSYLQEVADGFRFLFGEARLRSVTIAGAYVNFTVAFFEAMLVLIGARLFELEEPQEFGILFLFFGFGAVTGALLAPTVSARIGIGRAMVLSLLLYAVGFVSLTLVDGTVRTYGLLVIVGLAPPIGNVAVTTIRQLYTPDELLGRVTAASRAIIWGTLPLGALTGGMLADELQLITVARLLPLGVLLLAIWLVFTPVWNTRAPARF